MSASVRVPIVLYMAAALALAACKVYDPLYCDEKTECTDPARPFCDLAGEYPASDGVARTCIPDPDPEADAGPDGADGDDDGSDGGGSAPDASGARRVVQLATSISHTCALLSDGHLRCWGAGIALGYPATDSIGDDEHPYQAGDVPTGGPVKQVATGFLFTCALYQAGNVRCWGSNSFGELGYGHTDPVDGEDQTPDRLPDVDLNGTAINLAAGHSHACALLESGDVRCWGSNLSYQLATGDEESIGDDEVPGSRSPVQIGGTVTQLSAGRDHTCALLEGGFVRCWGTAPPLGQEGTEPVGDDETPAQAGNINVGGTVVQVAAGDGHTCALLSMGRVRCWGSVPLGYQEEAAIGDDETPASAGDVPVGGAVVELSGGPHARCALLEGGTARCWGAAIDLTFSPTGYLGQGNNEPIGDDEEPGDAGALDLGGPVAALSHGSPGFHQCALMQDGSVRCWGRNDLGQLGLGYTDTIGDDEPAGSADPVRVLE
jgi:hypothetical protein